MEQDVLIEIIVAIVILALLLIVIVNTIISSYVSKRSSAIILLNELNEEFMQRFIKLQQNQTYTKLHKNKASFDRTNFDKIFLEYCLNNESFLIETLKNLQHNQSELQKYKDKCDYIFNNYNLDWNNIYILKRREEILFNKYKLNPTTNIIITIHSKYTSPKGKNAYSKQHSYDSLDLELMIDNINRQNQFQKTKQYQRLLMTDSLRYDVLKRDGFKCVLCGATAKDGAKLHVDHILPVSKGGKTEKSNLRTLCDQCNLGKKDKFDYYGLN